MLHAQRTAADGVGLILILFVARPERQLVDEVEGHRPLTHSHLLGLPLVAIGGTDLIDDLVQATRRLVLDVILLALQLRRGIQHNVLDLALHILDPGGQPGDRVVVSHLLPSRPRRRRWHLGVLAAIDGHIAGLDASLDHAHFGMFAAAAEEAGRLQPEVTDLLLVAIDHTEAVLLDQRLVLVLLDQLLLLGGRLALLGFRLEEIEHLLEVALAEILNYLLLLGRHRLAEVLEEVVVEHILGAVVMIQHLGIEGGRLLRFLRQIQRLAVVEEANVARHSLIRWGKHRSLVLQR